jgi:hypothetical protein
MKAVGSPQGNGPRGRLKVTVAAVAVLMLILALIIGGCGSSADNSTTGSQLDDESAGATSVGSSTGAGTATISNDPVLEGYTGTQCVEEMTGRYGSQETAIQVCESIRADYGASTPRSELPNILPQVENKLQVTPGPQSGNTDTTPVTPTTPDPGPSVPDDPCSGPNPPWDCGIEIQVPGSPG